VLPEAVTGLDGLDLAVVGLYLGGVLLLSALIARRQRTGADYFLAGRRMGAWPLSLSLLANQASAVSLVGAPAFVALRPGGGLVWLQYELALPLAMLVLLTLLLPALRQARGASIYAMVEARFGRDVRRALALAFLLSRGLSLGVILYASSLVASEVLGLPVEPALVAVGLFSVLYTSLGGITADIWTDVVQLALLWGGTLAAGVYLLQHAGLSLLAAVPAERTAALVVDATGLGDGQTFALWPMLFGGFFLYLSYYGCDQSQAQRLLTARDEGAARRALLWTGLLRFPLAATYCGLGLLLAGLVATDASFAALMAGKPPDSLVPTFLTSYLPPGLRGLFLAAILAAAMSSIDSALNSLAAVFREDVLGRDPDAEGVWSGRFTALGFGLFAVVSGLAFARSGGGVLELVNQVGSAFYGPVLAVFVLATLAPRTRPRAVLLGLGLGLLANLLLARFAPGVSWLWWNPIGFTAALLPALLTGLRLQATPLRARREAAVLAGAFVVMLALLAAAQRVLWQA
jgi:SSS family solute:Na+ symporter